MKKVILSLCFLALMSLMTMNVSAQVTIGADLPPSENALLDLKQQSDSTATKGLSLPRVSLQSTTLAAPMSKHERGLVVYNINTAATVTPGFYYNDGTKWVKMTTIGNWFYMPSVAISTATITPAGPDLTIDLYAAWTQQFDGVSTPTTFKKNPSAPTAVVPFFPARNELNYYVTYFDNTALDITSISDSGVMSYRVIGNATDASYVNIVFVLK